MTSGPGVTIAGLLRSRPEAIGLSVDVLHDVAPVVARLAGR